VEACCRIFFPQEFPDPTLLCGMGREVPMVAIFPFHLDGALCASCICFATEHPLTNPEFVTKPFKDWKNACGSKRGSLHTHHTSAVHQASLKTADEFLAICNTEKRSINEHLSHAYHERVEKNRKTLLSIIGCNYFPLKTRNPPEG